MNPVPAPPSIAAPAPPPFARLFLALWPGPAALQSLAQWQQRWTWPRTAAVVPAERLHLTLQFIGPVPTARLPELLHGLAVPVRRFDLTFSQAEIWPRGLAVLCADAVPEPLAALHAQLQAALQRLALPVETRPFRPHVTLARKARGAVPPAEPLRLNWRAVGYALVQSQGGYRTLQHYR
jgi:RNA 2',3'-cyclic 3'-phosphodiesterase